MKLGCFSALLFCTALLLSGCGAREPQEPVETTPPQTAAFTRESKIKDVKNAPMFGSYGRLLFPVEDAYYSGDTLEELQLTYYSHIDPDETVKIMNTLRERAADGQTIFYDIYTDEEKAAEPAKEDTGLFFFKGVPGEKFAICNAGGAFAYVGAMQDSFPHALELSQKGYNAFALIYRPGAQTACEDLARAIRFIFDHADELEVDTDCYSLWGGSAGARMAAWLGSYGAEAFGGGDLPRPGAVIMQYTGLSEYSESDPPTLPVSVTGTASPTGGSCRRGSKPCSRPGSIRSFMCIPVWVTALALGLEPAPKAGSMMPSPFGNSK